MRLSSAGIARAVTLAEDAFERGIALDALLDVIRERYDECAERQERDA